MASNAVTNAATLVEDVPLLARKYEVLELLSSGSGGDVFLCRNVLLNGLLVAVKVLDRQFVAGTSTTGTPTTGTPTLEKFRAQLARHFSVTHPNVIRIYDYFEEDDIQAYSMEYVPGCSLSLLLESPNSVWHELSETAQLNETIRIGLELCSALLALNSNGLKHGQLSTKNVLVTLPEVSARTRPFSPTLGPVKLANAGLARVGEMESAVYASDVTRFVELLGEVTDKLKRTPRLVTDDSAPNALSTDKLHTDKLNADELKLALLQSLIKKVRSGEHGEGLHALLKIERELRLLQSSSQESRQSFTHSSDQSAFKGVSVFLAILALLTLTFTLFASDSFRADALRAGVATVGVATIGVATTPAEVPPVGALANFPRPDLALTAITTPTKETEPKITEVATTDNRAPESVRIDPQSTSQTEEIPTTVVSAATLSTSAPVEKGTTDIANLNVGATDAPLLHTVTYPGETLSIISDWYLGDVLKWQELAAANPKINPATIDKGQQILIPAKHLVRRDPLPESHIDTVLKNTVLKKRGRTHSPRKN